MKNLILKKGLMISKVEVPASKSYANRALLISALLSKKILLKKLPNSTDVTYLKKCLAQLGLESNEDQRGFYFKNSFPDCETKDLDLEVGEGGTTARFLATMLLLGKYKYRLHLGQRLSQRPWDEFISLVQTLGGRIELSRNILSLQGPVNLPRELKIDCSRTTQFASAFLIIGKFRNCRIVAANLETSQSYLEMTKKMVKDLPEMDEYNVPLDWSSASYPLAFGALNQALFFPGLHPDPDQADSKFYDLLKMLSCVNENTEGVYLTPLKTHRPVCLDVSDCLDLVPTLAFFLAHIEGEHKLTGVRNLSFKESDRLKEVIKLLKAFNRNAYNDDNSLIIHGNKNVQSFSQDLVMPDDHRMVMTSALFLSHHAGGTLTPADSVSKSFPEFFSLFQTIDNY